MNCLLFIVGNALLLSTVFSERWSTFYEGCYEFNSTNYKGDAARTVDNETCVRWDDPRIVPNADNALSWQLLYNRLLLEIKKLDGRTNHNMCRNTGTWHDFKPWCYIEAVFHQPINVYPRQPRHRECHVPFCSYDHCLLAPQGDDQLCAHISSHKLTRFHFDAASKSCKTFLFNGCKGNSNNFKNKETCEKTCPYCDRSQIQNVASIKCDSLHGVDFPGTKCDFTCSRGYEKTLFGKLRCMSGGHWHISQQVCRRSAVFNATTNCAGEVGSGKFSSTCQKKVGEKCDFTCNEGFARIHKGPVKCEADGKWQTDLSSLCDHPGECPNTFSNGHPSPNTIKCKRLHDTICTSYKCDEYYEKNSKYSRGIKCSLGNWIIGSEEPCIAKMQCKPLVVANGDVDPPNAVSFGVKATVTCNEGYEVKGEKIFQSTCSRDNSAGTTGSFGAWHPPIDACTKSLCGGKEKKCSKEMKCFSESQRCDGRIDCLDATDEEDCYDDLCQAETEFRCSTGRQCVHMKAVCNDKKDCADGSDEENCKPLADIALRGDVGKISGGNIQGFRCRDSPRNSDDTYIRIHSDLECNGRDDCPNGEDEDNCDGSSSFVIYVIVGLCLFIILIVLITFLIFYKRRETKRTNLNSLPPVIFNATSGGSSGPPYRGSSITETSVCPPPLPTIAGGTANLGFSNNDYEFMKTPPPPYADSFPEKCGGAASGGNDYMSSIHDVDDRSSVFTSDGYKKDPFLASLKPSRDVSYPSATMRIPEEEENEYDYVNGGQEASSPASISGSSSNRISNNPRRSSSTYNTPRSIGGKNSSDQKRFGSAHTGFTNPNYR